MTRDEFAPLVPAFEARWPLLDAWELLAPLEDLDAGLVAQALDDIAKGDAQPTPALVRRTANGLVRTAAAADPHPAADGRITFDEFCRRGAPHEGLWPEVTDHAERGRMARAVMTGMADW